MGSSDDCGVCDDVRIHVTLEDVDETGAALAAHLAPGSAEQLRDAIDQALRDVYEVVSES